MTTLKLDGDEYINGDVVAYRSVTGLSGFLILLNGGSCVDVYTLDNDAAKEGTTLFFRNYDMDTAITKDSFDSEIAFFFIGNLTQLGEVFSGVNKQLFEIHEEEVGKP